MSEQQSSNQEVLTPDDVLDDALSVLRQHVSEQSKAKLDIAFSQVCAGISRLRRSSEADAVLPCDVKVAPATLIRKGVKLSTLLLAIERRRGMTEQVSFETSARSLYADEDAFITCKGCDQRINVRLEHVCSGSPAVETDDAPCGTCGALAYKSKRDCSREDCPRRAVETR